jgi:phosphohistidine phosphatase
MKYLYIIRHAKAESSSYEIDDHDRKLLNKGIKRANNLNKWLKNKTPNLEALFCSSSLRTLQTMDIISHDLNYSVNKIVDKKLYGASDEMLINYLSCLDDKFNNVGIIGHQPSLQELAFKLVSSYAEGYDKVLNSNLSTSNAILILLNIKRWDQISSRVGILADYFDSKNT